ncbi:MAG: hypothetical protein ABSH32_17745 [Bryobacteraceae bacterium]
MDSTEIFFKYVIDLSAATREFLPTFLRKASKSVRYLKTQRQKIVAIKSCWRILHSLVKMAADGHTLHIPVALFQLLERRLSETAKLKGSNIVVLLSADLNYFQHRHSKLRKLATDLARTIPGAPVLPVGLGFIAVPYSQGSSLLTNSLICHELGHFAFEELSYTKHLTAKIDEALNSRIPDLGTELETRQAWCRRILATWLEELFCDLFGIYVIGPSFSFAFIELYGLLGLLNLSRSLEFSESHPAEACRLSEHLWLMKRLRWWRAIEQIESEHLTLISELGNRPDTEYRFQYKDNQELGDALKEAFLGLRETVRALVLETVGDLKSGLDEFRRLSKKIEEYFSRATVPSTLAIGGKDVYPDPLTILTSCATFYLTSMKTLAENTDKYKWDNISDRSDLSRRLEMWGNKAIEDSRILRAQLGPRNASAV